MKFNLHILQIHATNYEYKSNLECSWEADSFCMESTPKLKC